MMIISQVNANHYRISYHETMNMTHTDDLILLTDNYYSSMVRINSVEERRLTDNLF